ncbi:MAG: ankyrin repeat domain-containing protein [Candidatus Thiodiazotropha lotti]|nr:ankyrin repeat domain-containing protein [Candidatus Thiodiazotropha lotti]
MNDRENRTELHNAIIDGLTDHAKELILSDKCDLDAQDKQGYTPLHAAAQQKNVEIAQLLIEKGARLDLIDSWGNTPLWRALGPSEENISLIKLLLDKGIDPTRENNSGVSVVSHVKKIKIHPNRALFSKWIDE